MKICKRLTVLLFVFVGCFYVYPQNLRQDNKTIQEGGVKILRYRNGKYQLLVNGQPYIVKGIVYEPVKMGDKLSSSNKWMKYDFNKNGINDTAYESWVDRNKNNRRDAGERATGDFQLLKEMGVNTIRIYHPVNVDKTLLRDLYRRFGIRVIMDNFLGTYGWGQELLGKKGRIIPVRNSG